MNPLNRFSTKGSLDSISSCLVVPYWDTCLIWYPYMVRRRLIGVTILPYFLNFTITKKSKGWGLLPTLFITAWRMLH